MENQVVEKKNTPLFILKVIGNVIFYLIIALLLLFSIMNLEHVPFVILDEVESALDENNATVFGEYLHNYKNKTQLLVITHKKKTMEFLDKLYGITMQESGVSKIVSVKLDN